MIFIKACKFNGIKRVVGNLTNLMEYKADEAIKAGVAKPYLGKYSAGTKTKINLKDLK